MDAKVTLSFDEAIVSRAKRFAEKNKEMLVKRVVALVGTLSNEELYSSFEEAREMDRNGGKEET